MPTGSCAVARSRGFTYLWLLLAVAIGSVSLVALGTLWHTTGQRERERELIFRGEQIAQALVSYRAASGVGPARWPRTLEELVQDRRGPVDRHHLRQRYADPMTADGRWALITDEQGGVVGVRSTSQALAFIHREEDDDAAASASPSASAPPADVATASRGKTVAQHLFMAQAAMAAAQAASSAASAAADERRPSRPAWARNPDQRSEKPASALFQ